MSYQYENTYYKNAIEMYRKGDSSMIETELKNLSRIDIPQYDRETFFFIDEVRQIANRNNHKTIIATCTEVSNQIKKTSGHGGVYTSVLEDSLQTVNDCKIALNESLENDQYQSVLTKIVDFIRNDRNFHTAYIVLKEIDQSKKEFRTTTKENIALYFIERMQDVIDRDIKPKSFIGLHYKSDTWGKGFKNDDYVHYTDMVKKYKRAMVKKYKGARG